MTDKEITALKDGADALRYRAEKLRNHSAFEESKPWSEITAEQFERNAEILEGMAKR